MTAIILVNPRKYNQTTQKKQATNYAHWKSHKADIKTNKSENIEE